jgi:hypothetical protein
MSADRFRTEEHAMTATVLIALFIALSVLAVMFGKDSRTTGRDTQWPFASWTPQT